MPTHILKSYRKPPVENDIERQKKKKFGNIFCADRRGSHLIFSSRFDNAHKMPLIRRLFSMINWTAVVL